METGEIHVTVKKLEKPSWPCEDLLHARNPNKQREMPNAEGHIFNNTSALRHSRRGKKQFSALHVRIGTTRPIIYENTWSKQHLFQRRTTEKSNRNNSTYPSPSNQINRLLDLPRHRPFTRIEFHHPNNFLFGLTQHLRYDPVNTFIFSGQLHGEPDDRARAT